MTYEIHICDCLEKLKTMPDNSVDSIVTDPPYGLSFMGKKWDYDVPSQAIWEECLRVLKPGGHLLAFAGTRTQHRMAVRIEDAGFEIRDMIAWLYGSGMPKSFNLDRLQGDKVCGCSEPYTHNGAEKKTECSLRSVRDSDVSQAFAHGAASRKVLQSGMSKQSTPAERWEQLSTSEVRAGQSCMEGRGNSPQAQGELRTGSVRAGTSGRCDHGEEGRLCDGASLGDGEVDRTDSATDGGCASRRPRSAEQFTPELGAVAGQSESQALGAWPVCGGCGLPRVPSGLGTALKPALEPITVARKPLIGTVAANVIQHGTGALNIDGCRVGTETRTNSSNSRAERNGFVGGFVGGTQSQTHDHGRWPANLIHDGSEEVLQAFPNAPGQHGDLKETGRARPSSGRFGDMPPPHAHAARIDTEKSAARFFYCAKASRKDRNDGLPSSNDPAVAKGATMRENEDADWSKRNGNHHPTVKPTDLMAYLVRLVTPPGGVVLDPFLGSGSTGKAAIREGFRFIGCELSPEYASIAKARIEYELSKKKFAA